MQASRGVASDTAGLVLCGGRGARLGGSDKGLLRIGGMRAVERAAALLRPLCAEIIVSANRNLQHYRTLDLGVVVPDLRPGFCGPLAGIESAAAATRRDLLLVLPCDLPELSARVPERLLEALASETERDVVFARTVDRAHYLCAALRRRCIGTFSQRLDASRHAVRDAYSDLNSESLLFEGELAVGFRNVNAPSDRARP